MAWWVTEPDELAIGLAVALTPPTLSARAGLPDKRLALLMQVAAAILDSRFPYLIIG